jgi:hypothetical protein
MALRISPQAPSLRRGTLAVVVRSPLVLCWLTSFG